MRANIPFDTHAYVKKLIAAGVPERQAEVQAEALAEIALANLATKDDLRAGLAALEQKMEARFNQIESRFKDVEARFAQLELRLTLRMGAMPAAAVALIVTLQKLL